jgi:hypothetical protein
LATTSVIETASSKGTILFFSINLSEKNRDETDKEGEEGK